MSSSTLLSVPTGSQSPNRPRNRRTGSAGRTPDSQSTSTSTSLLAAASGSASSPASRRGSPGASRSRADSGSRGRNSQNTWTPGGRGSSTGRERSSSLLGKGLWDGSWTPSWASVQGLASSILSGDAYGSESERTASRSGSRNRKSVSTLEREPSRRVPEAWGPSPPNKQRPRIEDVAAGSMAEREAALKARRTASILESHEGVNGGLDVAGRFKKRSSDENLRDSALEQEPEDCLVYIHHVQPSDTYAGIVLKYHCREDVFRKANGLWSRDNIQIRKTLLIPVDACEIKGRTCEPPSFISRDVDLLAVTPGTHTERKDDSVHDDFFSPLSNGKAPEQPPAEEDPRPWTSVRWVALESFSQPVEIARVSRRNTGYFPPRRKKSMQTLSTLSTPRESLDLGFGSIEPAESPNSTSSRRPRVISPRGASHSYSASVPSTSMPRSRGGSVGGSVAGVEDSRPAWMRRPGGVGSLSKSVRAPGPEKDYFNTFARKHFPAINIDSMPSMSVMGAETARFGFGGSSSNPGLDAPSAVGIVESPFEEGRDAEASSRQGTGLDKAAAAVEMWLRGAFAKRPPGTPMLGARRPQQQNAQSEDAFSDLIELEDTNSDDGRFGPGPLLGGGERKASANSASMLASSSYGVGSSGWSGGDDATLRGRVGGGKGKKAD